MTLYSIFRSPDDSLSRGRRSETLERSRRAEGATPGVCVRAGFAGGPGGSAFSYTVVTAPSPDSARAFALGAGDVPGDLQAITETLPDEYIPTDLNTVPDGARLYAITRTMPPDTGEEELGSAILRSAACMAGYPGISWLRSYWDDERKQSRCFYYATSADLIRSHATLSRIPCDRIDEVEEVIPG